MVEKCRTIAVRNLFDRIQVRMDVRETARNLRFDLQEQARISMAAYNVISKMDMGSVCTGEVFVNHLKESAREGMQVVCEINNNKNSNFTSASFCDTSWLVDELYVEKAASDNTRVIVIIWANNLLRTS